MSEPTPHSIETEIKLRLSPGIIIDARSHLEQRGFSEREPRALQIDQTFDRPSAELRNARSLLRVRSTLGRAILTYKGPPFSSTPYKSREELEASTTDTAALLAILDRLGFVPSFRYEKFRTAFARAGEPGLVALDETPIGVFLELEGPGDWIDRTASTLGFTPKDYITLSYATLYRRHREAYGGPPDMIFKSRHGNAEKEP